MCQQLQQGKCVLTCKRKVFFNLFSCTPDVIMIIIIMIINGNIIDLKASFDTLEIIESMTNL